MFIPIVIGKNKNRRYKGRTKTITAWFGDVSSSITLEDYTQYWIPLEKVKAYIVDYYVSNSNSVNLNTYIIADVSQNFTGYLIISFDINKDYNLWINNINSNASFKVGLGVIQDNNYFFLLFNSTMNTRFNRGKIRINKSGKDFEFEIIIQMGNLKGASIIYNMLMEWDCYLFNQY